MRMTIGEMFALRDLVEGMLARYDGRTKYNGDEIVDWTCGDCEFSPCDLIATSKFLDMCGGDISSKEYQRIIRDFMFKAAKLK